MKRLRELQKFSIFALLPLAIFAAVLIIPFLQGLIYTFTDYNGFEAGAFVGFSNYVESLQDPLFWETLRFTSTFVIVSVILVNAVAFGLALLVTVKLRSANIFRTFFFVPNLIGGVILGVIWQFIFDRALTNIGKNFEIPFLENSWLIDPGQAFWALIIVTTWQMSGYLMIIYVTGLMSIEQDVLEAARIDGAGALRTLLSVKLPLMAQAFTISLFLSLRSGFMAYDVNVALTNGGPYRTTELISMHVYKQSFEFGFFDTGQAKAVLMFIIIALASVTQVAISKRMEVQR